MSPEEWVLSSSHPLTAYCQVIVGQGGVQSPWNGFASAFHFEYTHEGLSEGRLCCSGIADGLQA